MSRGLEGDGERLGAGGRRTAQGLGLRGKARQKPAWATGVGLGSLNLLLVLGRGDILTPRRCHLSLEATGRDECHSFPHDLFSVPLPPAWPNLPGVTAHNQWPLMTRYLSSDSKTCPDQRALVETDGEGGIEGPGQMDRRLAGAAGTEPGSLGELLTLPGAGRGWVPRAIVWQITDLAIHEIMS